MNSKFNTKHLLFLIVIIICFVVYYKFSTRKKNRLWDELKNEYPALSFESELNGIVTQIVQTDPRIFRNVPDRALIIINDTLKRRLRVGHEFDKTSTLPDGTIRPMLLGEALAEGDRIVKNQDTYIVSFYKFKDGDTIKYTFGLTDDLGYPLKVKVK